ncbi:MAG: hypothetical protein NT031_12830 [Planctomycetota bacterium]|nr:hypothetical protein [Planctomycetota bacterium]
MMQAKAWSDDHKIEVEFDATRWFTRATDRQILQLAQCDWGMDYPADEVVQEAADWDRNARKLFAYLELINEKETTVGSDCQVIQEQAMAWVLHNRPWLVGFIELMNRRGCDPDECMKTLDAYVRRAGGKTKKRKGGR